MPQQHQPPIEIGESSGTNNKERQLSNINTIGELPQMDLNVIPLPIDLSMFAYVSSTNLKIIVILEESSNYSDPDLRSVRQNSLL